jgi:signal transduction histidine kinase
VGIPVNAVKSESHGILNIKQRAQLIGAKVDWRKPNNFDSGTELKIELSFELEHRREA